MGGGGGTPKEGDVREIACILYWLSVRNAEKRGDVPKNFKIVDVIKSVGPTVS